MRSILVAINLPSSLVMIATPTWMLRLSNCIPGAKAIAIAVKALGFLVHKDAPAVVFIYAAGHGMELRDRYLLSIDFELEKSGDVDENFVLY